MSDTIGFKAIEISRTELLDKLEPSGSKGICDYCMSKPKVGFYVAVLDQWLCPKCYDEFVLNNNPDPRDARYEERRFELYKRIFGL